MPVVVGLLFLPFSFKFKPHSYHCDHFPASCHLNSISWVLFFICSFLLVFSRKQRFYVPNPKANTKINIKIHCYWMYFHKNFNFSYEPIKYFNYFILFLHLIIHEFKFVCGFKIHWKHFPILFACFLVLLMIEKYIGRLCSTRSINFYRWKFKFSIHFPSSTPTLLLEHNNMYLNLKYLWNEYLRSIHLRNEIGWTTKQFLTNVVGVCDNDGKITKRATWNCTWMVMMQIKDRY